MTNGKKILTIDTGNTDTVFGLFQGKKLAKTWRIFSNQKALKHFTTSWKIPVDQVVISSVVPSLKKPLMKLGSKMSRKKPLYVSHRLKMPIRLRVKNPGRVGVDRIANAIGAYSQWKRNLLIIDFGTATTFDVVDKKGNFLGGAIAPGLKTFQESLTEKCPILPKTSLKKPTRVIGKTTKEAIQSGVLLGYASLVEGMIQKVRKEFKKSLLVVATGGLSSLMKKLIPSIQKIEPHLILKGLQWLTAEK